MKLYLPLVSVIIPAYNAEIFIARTLESVISQTYNNLEILVVDDGSKDTTAEIVESFIQRDNRITLLQQQNAGVAAARNLAISKSTGEFIAPIDADDIWHPQKIEKQVQCFLESNDNVGLVYNWSVLIDEQDEIFGIYDPKHYFTYLTVEGNAYPALLYTNIVGNGSVPLIRRVCFEKVGNYNCELRQQNAQGCEDWDIYLRIAEFYEYRVVPQFLVGYRQVQDSMSRASKSMAKSFDLVMTDAWRRRPEFPQQIYNWSISYFCIYIFMHYIERNDYWDGLVWFYKALQRDYIILLQRSTYKHVTHCILKLVTKHITSLIRHNHQSDIADNANNVDNGVVNQKITIDDINKKMQKPQRIVRWKPYELLMYRRWSKILEFAEKTPLLISSPSHSSSLSLSSFEE
ncbi:MAG: glycosyltransferase family 2 protein [Calothrix sp. C42_A2020_038]|nr:glycosyltransferase family 2 protein [Calothrix sp. C42_A2020_038]